MVSNSYAMTVDYDYALSDTLILTPNIEARFYSGGTRGEERKTIRATRKKQVPVIHQA